MGRVADGHCSDRDSISGHCSNGIVHMGIVLMEILPDGH